MASEKPEPKNRKRKSSTSSVSSEKKISNRTARREPAKSEDLKVMAEENQSQQSGTNPTPGGEEFQRSAQHARQAAEGLRAAAGAVAQEYRGRAEEYWNDA